MRAPTEILGVRYFLLGVIFARTDTRVESSHQGTPQNKNKSSSFHLQTARAFGPGLCLLLLSQLSTGCVTCHTSHGCVTHFRPILGNLVEVTLVTSPFMYIVSHAKGTSFP